ncbi:molecular chaperone [Cronobacter turicensis]|jgi:P pilus assembly chaperone PapD|uniref:fimbrial biogenesis chaperone n=1 Tax=Cronobacter turicensis TaxID=413502 RepID=UPI0005A4F5ED|nr:molecular chaperone [Cronobacter turicensis]EKM0377433.1 molecular chaperone [Cronobacter turicensis]ELY4479596.1 molecular chaperone [Cronobacter turicensis]ELY7489658.1 molecular chaperone [Cronobacter turicensis]EMD9176831.1 molecular chaperone [Cronobacter turicensis]MDI6473548.1 molecular chaperone [Cronobacter turicensis]
MRATRKYILRANIFLLLILLVNNATAGGIVVGGTRVIYEGNKKEAALSIKNNSAASPFLLQSWVDNGDGKTRGPFMVTPPLFRIESEEDHELRIAKTGSLPEDRESLFYLNIRAIPPSSPEAVNTLKLVVKTRIKLFYRPQALVVDAQTAYQQLKFHLAEGHLLAENPTPFYMVFDSLKVGATRIQSADMLAPFASQRFALPTKETGRVVSWRVINDYGGVTKPETRTL